MKLIQLMNIQKYYQLCDFRKSGSVFAEDEVLHGTPCRLGNT